MRGKANPKSSTGRIDVFTRVITDESYRFDEIADGYEGPLYLEVVPLSFPVRVREDLTLNQLRLVGWAPRCSPTTTCARFTRRSRWCSTAASRCPRRSSHFGGGLFLGLDLHGDARGYVGYRARDNAPLLDVAKSAVAPVDPEPFWETVRHEEGDRVVLTPQRFYLLMSNEAVCIPPTLASRDDRVRPDEWRAAHALRGLLRPRFRLTTRAGMFKGSRAALEVRAHDVPFMIEHGQRVFKFTFEHMLEAPDAPLRAGHRVELSTPERDAEQALRPPVKRPDASRPRRCGGGGAEAGVSVGTTPLGVIGLGKRRPTNKSAPARDATQAFKRGLFYLPRNVFNARTKSTTVRVDQV